MKIKFKKLHPHAHIPTKAHPTDAGFDLYAAEVEINEYGQIICHTGIAVEIPDGYVGLVFPRSSICNTSMTMLNCVGVIDSGYRGEITARFRRYEEVRLLRNKIATIENNKSLYHQGDRVAQLIILPYPEVVFEEAEVLSDTDRGIGGYGSSGR